MKKKEYKFFLLIILIVSLIAIDQIIKITIKQNINNSSITLIRGFLNFTYVENTGGAFGIGNSNILLFILFNIAIIAFLVFYIILNKEKINKITLFSIALIISGGIGNLIDRIFRGYVIDYIDINPLIKYPMFNFADICIVIGCILVIIGIIREKR